MEGLRIEDLNFDSGAEVFDVFKAGESGGDKKEVDIKDPLEEKKETSTGSEGIAPESVAKGEDDIKETGQGRASEAGKEGSNSSSQNDTEKLYSSLAAQFKAKGVLPGLDLEKTEIKSLEDIEKAMMAELESRLTEKQKAIDEAMKVGAPTNEVAEQLELISKLKEIPETYVADENNGAFRKNVMVQDFINKGYEKERADIMAQRSVDSGTDVEDAQFALKALIKHEEGSYEKIMNNARETEEKNVNGIKDYLAKNDKIIGDIPLTAAQKDEIYKSMTTDLGNKENAFMKAQKEDPIGSRVKLEALFHITKGFTDFSVFGKAKESSITNGITDLLRGTNFTEDGKVQTQTQDSNSSFTLKDIEGLTF